VSSVAAADLSTVPPALSRGRYLVIMGLRLLNKYSFAFALLLTIALLATTIVRDPNPWSDTFWVQLLANMAPMALAAMASTPAIISGGGGFDLSISPLMYFLGEVFIVWLAPHGLGGYPSVPIILAFGAAIGAVNGLLIILLRVPPVVVTLAVFFVLIGVDLRMLRNPNVGGYLGSSSWVHHLADKVGPIPGALFTLGVPLAIWFALSFIPYRRTLYAVGSNDATAFSSGVNVALVRVLAYSLGGLFAAVGGLALIALTSSANPSLSQTYTLLAISAVALGGTSLWGGRGGLIGALLGAASIYLLGNLLISLQVNESYLQVMYGGMLLIAVVLGGIAAQARRVPA
jgi:ribose transport system permease protein